MEETVYNWVKDFKEKNAPTFDKIRVFEGGSLDVNGSVRPIFSDAAEYVGVDIQAGDGVDWVGYIHEYNDRPPGYFDLCLYLNAMSYDKFWRYSLQKLVSLLRPGGCLLLTTPSLGYNIEFQVKYLLGWSVSPSCLDNYYRIKTPADINDEVSFHSSFEKIHFKYAGANYNFKVGIYAGKGRPVRSSIDETKGSVVKKERTMES